MWLVKGETREDPLGRVWDLARTPLRTARTAADAALPKLADVALSVELARLTDAGLARWVHHPEVDGERRSEWAVTTESGSRRLGTPQSGDTSGEEVQPRSGEGSQPLVYGQ